MSATDTPIMLSVKDLSVDFSTPAGNLRAVDGVSLELAEGETYAIVGESGSGKSVFSRTLINLLAGNGTRDGSIEIGGRDIDTLSKAEAKHFFGVDVAMVFQDPMTSLNPVKRIDAQLTEAMRVPPQGLQVGGQGPCDRALEAGAHPVARATDAPVPARTVGWHASASRDRHGARLRAPIAHRRRADDRRST